MPRHISLKFRIRETGFWQISSWDILTRTEMPPLHFSNAAYPVTCRFYTRGSVMRKAFRFHDVTISDIEDLGNILFEQATIFNARRH